MLDLMYSGNALARQFEAGHRFLLIEEEGRGTGFASHGPVPDGPGVEAHKLYVLPDDDAGPRACPGARGEGRRRARAHGSLRLDVNRNNPAIRLHLKGSASPVREQVTDIGGGFIRWTTACWSCSWPEAPAP